MKTHALLNVAPCVFFGVQARTGQNIRVLYHVCACVKSHVCKLIMVLSVFESVKQQQKEQGDARLVVAGKVFLLKLGKIVNA